MDKTIFRARGFWETISRARISDNGQQFYFARGLIDINFISREDFDFSHQLHGG